MDAINIDDLTSIARGRDDRSKKDNPIVLKFINEVGITSGNIRVPTFVVYYTFRQLGYDKVGKTEFFRTFNKCFRQIRTRNQRYYLLNDVISTDPSYINKAKSYDSKTQTTGGRRVKTF